MPAEPAINREQGPGQTKPVGPVGRHVRRHVGMLLAAVATSGVMLTGCVGGGTTSAVQLGPLYAASSGGVGGAVAYQAGQSPQRNSERTRSGAADWPTDRSTGGRGAEGSWYPSTFFGGDPELDVGAPERGTYWGNLLQQAGPVGCPGASCPTNDWRDAVNAGRSLSLRDRVIMTNQFVQRKQYREDPDHAWGADDWKTPERFVELGWGDCEDFAVAQYYLLRAMGTPASQLRLVRTEEPGALDHIALAVLFTDQIVVMDYDGLWPPDRYGPLMASMNEDRVWAHRDPFGSGSRTARAPD